MQGSVPLETLYYDHDPYLKTVDVVCKIESLVNFKFWF